MTKQPPLVSIVIPAFNAAAWVRETLDSALAQTHPRCEIIVVDDGSTDDTATIVQSEYGARVRLARQQNRGLSAARNAGLEAARGSYVQFLDADDLLFPSKIERQLEVLEQRPYYTAVYSDLEYVEDGLRRAAGLRQWFASGHILRPLLRRNFIVAHAPLLRTDAVRSVGGFDTSLSACEDYDLWLRLSAAGHSFYCLDEVLLLYRRVPGSMSSDAARQAAATARVLRRVPRYARLAAAERAAWLRHLLGVECNRVLLRRIGFNVDARRGGRPARSSREAQR